MAFGQKTQLALRALAKTLAPQFARTNGNARLNDVIASAARVVTGVEKGENALALVVVHAHKPHKGHGGWRGQQACFEHIALKSVEQDHAAHNEQNKQGSAKVGLHNNKPAGHKPHGEHTEKVFPAQGAAVACKQAGHQYKHRKFCHFRGLNTHETQRYPALCAVYCFARYGHKQEQKYGYEKERPSQIAQLAVVKKHGQQHAHKAAQTPDELPLIKGIKRRTRLYTRAAGRIQVAYAHKIEQQHTGQKAPVNIAV